MATTPETGRLVAITNQLRAMSRNEDLIASRCVEEFLLLLPDTALDAAAAFAEVLRAAQANMAVTLSDGSIAALTASMGVAASHVTGSLDDLLREANAALYVAKQPGRNQFKRAARPGIA